MELAELKTLTDKINTDWKAFMDVAAVERTQIKESGTALAEVKEKLAKIDKALTDATEAKDSALRTAAALKSAGVASGAAVEDGVSEYKSALNDYMRKGGESAGKALEAKRVAVKSMSALSGPEGGFWLTLPEIDPTFRKDSVETSPMRDLATVQTIGGPSMKGKRRATRSSTGGWVGEQDSRGTTATGTLGEWEIFAREMYAYPEAPQSFMDDAMVDVEAWLRGEINFEFGILENTAFVTGNGVKRPRGINTYPDTDGGDGAFIEAVDITTSNSLVGGDLINVQEALKEPYQRNATWAFKRSTLSVIRKLSTGSTVFQYLWQPGLTAGAPSTILGNPYVFMADLPAIAAENDTYPIFYGDFRQTYKILDRAGVTVLRDAFTNKGFVGFYTVKRVGGDVVHFESMKRLENKT